MSFRIPGPFGLAYLPQRRKRDAQQVQNAAGGFGYQLDDWGRLDRFLVLGSEGGTYYASPVQHTLDNMAAVARCLEADGSRAVARIVQMSFSGRAPKNGPALAALALAASADDLDTRRLALQNLPLVARTGTDLFTFYQTIKGMRGWGRTLARGVSAWYTDKTPEQLGYQAIKYRQREGVSHRDMLRLAHPRTDSEAHQALFEWICRGTISDQLPRQVLAFEAVQRAQSKDDVVKLILSENLPREAIPTEWLSEPAVWDALLQSMPMTAMIRNLGTLTKLGVVAPFSFGANLVVERLGNQERLNRARIHPMAVLTALVTYRNGHGMRGSGTWEPVPQVVDALDDAFYAAFGVVNPTGKRLLLALDVSGSMEMAGVAGSPLTAAQGAAAMAMVTARTEPNYHVMGFSDELKAIPITAKTRLDAAMQAIRKLTMGGTDCALPMIYAREKGLAVDGFVIYTDNETHSGSMHPIDALDDYREATGINAKVAIVGMTATQSTILNTGDDPGLIDLVGWDSAAPEVLAQHMDGDTGSFVIQDAHEMAAD